MAELFLYQKQDHVKKDLVVHSMAVATEEAVADSTVVVVTEDINLL